MTEPNPPDDAAGRPEWAESLTRKQWMFVEEYLVDLNATRAAERAGYDAGENGLSVIGSENLRKPAIAAAIDAALAARPGITRTRIVDELAAVAFANAGEFFSWGPEGVTIKASSELSEDQRRVVAKVSQTKTKEGGTIKVELADKLSALGKLYEVTGGKMRVSVENPDGTPLESDSHEVAKAIMAILRTAVEKEQPA